MQTCKVIPPVWVPISRWCLPALALSLSLGCATVRPEQRAILADPKMQYDDQGMEQTARQHALENREGSIGGGSVEGGGCGCN
jgi:hypothetical protein